MTKVTRPIDAFAAPPGATDASSVERPDGASAVNSDASAAIGCRHPVDALAEEYSIRLRAGENPEVEEFAQRAPEHCAVIQSLFPTIAMIERMTRREQAASSHIPIGLKEIGDFRIIREIGRGGMGIV